MSDRTIESLEASEAMRKEIERLRVELEAKDFVISCQRADSDDLRATLAASEAACAQMREALRGVVDNEKCDTDGGHNSVGCFACASYIMAIEAAERALATDAGRNWIDATGAVESMALPVLEDGNAWIDDTPLPAAWVGKSVLIVVKP